MEEMKICEHCGTTVELSDGEYLDGEFYCRHCLDDLTIVCENCGERVLRGESVEERICQTCYDEDYCRCDCCGHLMHNDDANYYNGYTYCDDCYSDRHHEFIEEYDYKPTPIFYGSGQPHYGVELEIDSGGEYDSSAEDFGKIANKNNTHLYFKHDSSLEDGLEIVSHPATLDYHLHNIPWEEVMKRARELKYLSHTAQTCGLHIHINRAALGETVEEQENTIGRIVYFFEKHWDQILHFSRRTEGQANRWAARYGCSTVNPKESLKGAKDSCLGRYTAVNLANQFTVELRIFRGTLRYETFVATLQFVDKLCHDAIELSDEQFQTMTWNDFTASVEDMPELMEYLKIRGLEVV